MTATRGSGRAVLDVMIVVVVHDSAEMLARCLGALSTATRSIRSKTIVVDSGSRDDPAAVSRQHGVECLRVPNRGLSAAFNRALAREDVCSARYVLQLNPDVELPVAGLDALVAHADQRPGCGVLAPRQVDQYGKLIPSIGIEPAASRYWRAIDGQQVDWNLDPQAYQWESEADWVMGACMLLRREMLRSIGGFDERFFLCSEEVDLCRRAREAGWSVNFLPSVTVVHPLAGRRSDPHRLRLEEWSRILYLRKWQRLRIRCLMRLAVITRLARLALGEKTRNDPEMQSRIRLGAALRFRPREYRTPPGTAGAGDGTCLRS